MTPFQLYLWFLRFLEKNPFDIQDFCFVNHSKRTFIIVKKRKSTIPTRETSHPTGQTDNFRLILIPFPSQILPVLIGNFSVDISRIIRSTLTFICKPWKTYPEFFPKFQFSGEWHRQISGKIIQYFFGISISRAWAGTISGKFIHFFVSNFSVFVKYRDMS